MLGRRAKLFALMASGYEASATAEASLNTCASVLATLQADLVAAMAKAGSAARAVLGNHPVATISSSNLAP